MLLSPSLSWIRPIFSLLYAQPTIFCQQIMYFLVKWFVSRCKSRTSHCLLNLMIFLFLLCDRQMQKQTDLEIGSSSMAEHGGTFMGLMRKKLQVWLEKIKLISWWNLLVILQITSWEWWLAGLHLFRYLWAKNFHIYRMSASIDPLLSGCMCLSLFFIFLREEFYIIWYLKLEFA